MKQFYIDCEFDGHNGPLLSVAIVSDTDDGIHIQTRELAKDPWVKENVIPKMLMHNAPTSIVTDVLDVGTVLRQYIGDDSSPIILADSPVDIARFCQAISTGTDGQWASTDYRHMVFEVHNVDCYPTVLKDAVQHNAWWDAMALRSAIRFEVSA
jgi:hypothetical protein